MTSENNKMYQLCAVMYDDLVHNVLPHFETEL